MCSGNQPVKAYIIKDLSTEIYKTLDYRLQTLDRNGVGNNQTVSAR
jgi:hypothetical protein